MSIRGLLYKNLRLPTPYFGAGNSGRLFNRYFKPTNKDIEPVKELFKNINASIKAELNDETFNNELKACVEVHLLRKIKYGTLIPLVRNTISDTLKAIKFDNLNNS